MGGNLFKVGRIQKEEYFNILDSLKPILTKHFGDHYRIPVAYRNKKDYGDVDIIVDAAVVLNKTNWKNELCKDLNVTQVQSQRNVFSMLYRNFQTDIFLVGTNKLDTCYNFMCYNILGNLIGRIYHKFDLRYGEDGLHYVLRGYNNHISKEVLVSRDMREILKFIGLSYDRWEQGFADLEQIFQYVMISKYFCSNSYDLKYFNIQKRATERPDFNKFLDYLETNKIDKNFEFDKNKEVYLPMIDEFFKTDLQTKHKEHLEKQRILEAVSKKFNGKIVMDLIPELNGKELGDFICGYKEAYKDVFNEVTFERTQEEINKDILHYYNNLYEKLSI